MNVRGNRLTGKVRMAELIRSVIEESLAFLVVEQIEVEEHFADNVIAGNRTENAAVARVVPVIAHEEILIFIKGDGFLREYRHALKPVILEYFFAVADDMVCGDFDSVAGLANQTLHKDLFLSIQYKIECGDIAIVEAAKRVVCRFYHEAFMNLKRRIHRPGGDGHDPEVDVQCKHNKRHADDRDYKMIDIEFSLKSFLLRGEMKFVFDDGVVALGICQSGLFMKQHFIASLFSDILFYANGTAVRYDGEWVCSGTKTCVRESYDRLV